MIAPKPYKSIGFGDIYAPKPYTFIGFGDIYARKPYKFIRFGDAGSKAIRDDVVAQHGIRSTGPPEPVLDRLGPAT